MLAQDEYLKMITGGEMCQQNSFISYPVGISNELQLKAWTIHHIPNLKEFKHKNLMTMKLSFNEFNMLETFTS